MANTFTPNGFMPVRRFDGASWNDQLTQRAIAAANNHQIFRGDPIVQLSSGYIDRVAVGSIPTQGTLGIFWGCELPAGPTGSPFSPYYPGTQTQDSTCLIITDPNVIYRCWVGTGTASAAGGPATLADIGQNFNWQLGTGNTLNGQSGAYLDFASLGITSTLPLTILGLVTTPPGVNGTDPTTAGNLVEVLLNQQAYKVGTTGV